jgi:hypothetical protein
MINQDLDQDSVTTQVGHLDSKKTFKRVLGKVVSLSLCFRCNGTAPQNKKKNHSFISNI